MKHLKSSLRDLREVFDRGVTVRYVAEPLVSFDDAQPSEGVRAFMKARDFDIVGVRRNGTVMGFVERRDLESGTLGDHVLRFEERLLVQDSESLVRGLDRLKASPRAFVCVFGQVAGIVTKGDLQKAPVRMWLFSLVSLLEMQMLRLIRRTYGGDSWSSLISEDRLEKARVLLQRRQRRNEAIDLADCLQFADKRSIVSRTQALRAALGLGSRGAADRALKELERLRDELAHAQDFVTGRWPDLVALMHSAETLLQKCEDVGE